MRALIVGMGGLGCPASLGLARGGITALTLVDPDVVELSNLHRQPWHRTSDLGKPKVASAKARLGAAFPSVAVTAMRERVTAANAHAFFAGHDVVIDGTDGVHTKFLLSDASVKAGTRLVYGGVLQLEGQLFEIRPGGPCLRCLFEVPPAPDAVPTCAQAGVLGSLAGFIGARQAMLALSPPPAEADVAWLSIVDAKNLKERKVRIRRRDDCLCASPRAIELQDEAPRC